MDRPPLPPNLLRDEQGNPLRLYHGTVHEFDEFEHYNSIGFHFGDKEQANYFAQQAGGRCFPVFLRVSNGVDLSGRDLGWLFPKPTAFLLMVDNIISPIEARPILGSTKADLSACLRYAYAEGEMAFLNGKIVELLKSKEIDAIKYTNRNEPSGTIGRIAYCVMSASQIISALTYEALGCRHDAGPGGPTGAVARLTVARWPFASQ